jgi:hypothetical protein
MRPAVIALLTTWRSLWRPALQSRATLMLCLVGVLLPNAFTFGAELAGIGTPPRTAAILAYATLALIARLVPPAVTVGLYLVVAVYDAVATIALLFNLAPSEIALALHLGAELDLFASPLYVALGVGLVAMGTIDLVLMIRSRRLTRHANAVVVMGLAAACAIVDFVANTSPHYQFGTLYAAGQPMESAAGSSGFRDAVLGGRGNALLVIVEALGRFDDPARQDILMAPFADPALARRYRVTSGSTTYYGSTTAGEMRELCASREPYQALLEGHTIACLPAEMAARGYATIGMHNFTGAFFDRRAWYPKLGFDTMLFKRELAERPTRTCGGPFRGPCDVDMVPFISERLAGTARPTFLYWMTLSTHVPIAPHDGTARLGCDKNGGAIGQAEVCHMTEMWIDLFERIAKLALDRLGTEILVVGDHAPPLWSKAGRRLFTPGQVSWVRLSPRRCGAGEAAAPELSAPVKGAFPC